MAEIPVDIDAAQGFADWRQRVSWPVSLAEANAIAAVQAAQALAWAKSLDDRLARDAVLLALPNILGYARAIVLAALAASRAAASRQRLVSTASEFAYLQSGEGAPPARIAPVLPPERVRFHFARRLARVRSWSGLKGLPRAMLRPDALAVSHNCLLCAMAARGSKSIGFRHAEDILDAARSQNGSAPMPEDHADSLAEMVLCDDVADEPYRSRARKLLEAMAQPQLRQAARDMAALRNPKLAEAMWSGSGGLYAPRAVGLEILRRGGHVRRFDHGTPKGFVRAPEINELVEFSVSSEFVVATEAAAAICRDGGMGAPGVPEIVIQGAEGDPSFARVPASCHRARARRPRVAYAPTQLLGFRQLLPVQPPDVVHLAWQIEVAEALKQMEVDLVCQPHPEGLLKGRAHPLDAVATTIRGNFLAQLEAADVFVFDYPSTTALWEVACTDARIVFLDIGSGTMTPQISKLFAERAQVIPVAHDDANRPILDSAALRDAVLGEVPPSDPFPLRRLLAGAN